jgi:hypothetical protein
VLDMRVVPTDNIQSLPDNPYSDLTPERNFGNLVYFIMCDGLPDGYHIHPWDWDGDVATYNTDTGRPVVAIVRNYNGQTLSDDDITQITNGFLDVFNTFGLGTDDIRTVADTTGIIKAGTMLTPEDGYFMVIPDFGGIPGNASIATWSDEDDGHWFMESARMRVNTHGSSLFEAARIEAARGWGIWDAPTHSEPWASDVTYFAETPNMSDFTTVDVKLFELLKNYEPESIFDLLGIQEWWDNPSQSVINGDAQIRTYPLGVK